MTAAEKAEAKKIANEKYRKKFPPLGLWVAPEVVERIPAAFPGSTRREVLNTALHRWGHLAENRQLPRPPYLTPRTKKKKPAEEEPAGEGRAGEEPAKKGRVTWEVRVSGRVKRRIDEIADEIEWRPALVARALVERELEDAERRTRDAEPPENAGAAESGAGAARGGAPDGRARWRVSR